MGAPSYLNKRTVLRLFFYAILGLLTITKIIKHADLIARLKATILKIGGKFVSLFLLR